MELLPLTCDYCGNDIETIEEGWVQWKRGPELGVGGNSLQLVHHARCNFPQPDAKVCDLHLSEFIGVHGLGRLLSLRSRYGIDPVEVEYMVMRLNVPGYERAFANHEAAQAAGAYTPGGDPRFMFNSSIALINQWLDSRHDE